MTHESDVETNLSALAKLRSQPRGTHIDSRIAAIQNLLNDPEIFRTIQDLRWPKGVLCPHCDSPNIVVKASPTGMTDSRKFYECLDCKDQGDPSDFDDLTGFPIEGTLHELRQWVLCWYLFGFCSITQIAKVLGISLHQVIAMVEQGTQITHVTQKKLSQLERDAFGKTQKERQLERTDTVERIEHDQLKSRSEGLGKFKPGPKSSA